MKIPNNRILNNILKQSIPSIVNRNYSSSMIYHNQQVRELLLHLMHATPSKREVQHFLKNFGEKPTVNNSLLHQTTITENFLQNNTYNQVALIKVKGPFTDWTSIGKTIYNLQKLGLISVVITDTIKTWDNNNNNSNGLSTSPADLIKSMMKESAFLVDAIENAGGRAKLIYGGNALENPSMSQPIQINFDLIQSTLNNDQIPIIVPISMDKGGMHHPLQANNTTLMLLNGLIDQGNTPAKMIVINNEGGIPNHAIPDSTHSLINLQEEFRGIETALKANLNWSRLYLDDLFMIRESLSRLPTTSSAIIVPVSSLPSTLITNLITDKPLYSSSLPIPEERSRVNQTKTTVLRKGTKLKDYHCLADVDLNQLTGLLEDSFQKKLDTQSYYQRLNETMKSITIAGDYEGAVICTNEITDTFKNYTYLDKFAIAPKSQGIGLNDLLWKRLCFQHSEFFWRSRKVNGVNKWYFDRSDGYLRLKDTDWIVFWHGSKSFMQDYSATAKTISASFH